VSYTDILGVTVEEFPTCPDACGAAGYDDGAAMSLLDDSKVPPLPQGTPNPLRPDGLYPVLVAPGLFEELAARVEWGEPDADGFYTPTLYSKPVELRP
jgi:hypothetical protein